MYVPWGEFKDWSGNVEGNGGKDNRVVVKFKTQVNIKREGIYSLPGSDDCFGSAIKEDEEGEEAD